MHADRGQLTEEVWIPIDERFDREEAERIQARLAEADPGRCVVLDFHETRSFDACALARLARHIARGHRPVVLHGVCESHCRLLSNVLLDPSVPAPRARR